MKCAMLMWLYALPTFGLKVGGGLVLNQSIQGFPTCQGNWAVLFVAMPVSLVSVVVWEYRDSNTQAISSRRRTALRMVTVVPKAVFGLLPQSQPAGRAMMWTPQGKCGNVR